MPKILNRSAQGGVTIRHGPIVSQPRPPHPAQRHLHRSAAAAGSRHHHTRPRRSRAGSDTARCWRRPTPSPSCRRATARTPPAAGIRCRSARRAASAGSSSRSIPAGHILGSAQVLLEHQGQRMVVTGDYKRLDDRTAQPFELIKCDLLVTEATFGLPVFQHPKPADEIARLLRSVAAFPERAHVIGCYALGKAQRVISLLRESGYDAPIYLHGAMLRLCELYRSAASALGRAAALARCAAKPSSRDRSSLRRRARSRTAGRDGCPIRCSRSPRAG